MRMEEIYPPSSFFASDHLKLKEYFKEFSTLLVADLPETSATPQPKNDTEYLLAMKSLMESVGADVQLNDINCLRELCSLDLLNCDGENTRDFPMDVPVGMRSSERLPAEFVISEVANNTAVYTCKVEMEKSSHNLYNNLRNKRSHYKETKLSVEQRLGSNVDLHLNETFIIVLHVYKPFAFRYGHARNSSEKMRFSHEITALGTNSLYQIRDTIICSSDEGICKEVESTSEDISILGDAKTKYPSGFIFIDDTFYNDFRDPDSIDYSFTIIEWAKDKKIKGLQSKNMENVTLDSLTPRFGYPYLYMHQGDCEHLLVFADAKTLDHKDCLSSKKYPYVTKLIQSSNRMCCMCSTSFAKWIIVECNRLPESKMFMCTECCTSYNYIDDKKQGTFKLYPYYEKHVGSLIE